MIRVSDGKQVGEYLNLYIHTAGSTVDILNPEVVDQFIAQTHEKYKERFGNDFSKKIRGFFTDEPQYQRWNTPYTRLVAEYFEKEYEEDILDGLGYLFVEKEGYRKFRYRYWKAMQTLMLNNFSKKVFDWCNKNEVEVTGHYIEETTMGNQMMCCGGVMPFYEYLHIPGIDWLGKDTSSELSPKQVGSVARQLGKKQVLTETFGCAGWDVTPKELRRIAGFQYVNGVNIMCQHLIPYAEHGSRKRDYPAHFSTINPWVREDFGVFNDYFTELGAMLAESEEPINVAMLHPIRSTYFEYKREKISEGFGVADLDEELRKACRTLSSLNIGYHFLDETLMEKYGFVDGDKIGCGACSYEYLVLPSMITMDKTTERLVREYVIQGGKVLLLGTKPTYLEADSYEYDYLNSNCSLEEIANAQPFVVANKETEIYTTYRVNNGKTFLFVQNNSTTETYTQTYSFKKGVQSFAKWNPITGEIEILPLTVKVQPEESLILFLREEEAPKQKVLKPYKLRFSDALCSFKENQMPVDTLRYSKDGRTYSEKMSCIALFQQLLEERYEGKIYFKYEFEVRKVPQDIILRAEECNAQQVSLNGQVLQEKNVPRIEKNLITYDIAPMVRVGVNEYVVEMNWQESESVYYALFGENVTESLKNCIVYDSELEPIYIAGSFGVYVNEVKDTQEGYVEVPGFYIGEMPGRVSELVTDGLSCVSGEVVLSQKVTLDSKDILLEVEGVYLTARVFVNGKKAGDLLFDTALDISEFVNIGENEIKVRFLISNRNLMGPHHFTGPKDMRISPRLFEFTGTWKDGKSPLYHESYDLRLFYK